MHVSFKLEEMFVREVPFEIVVDGSSSRYAEPEADGVRPVLRTTIILAKQSSY